MIDLAHEKTPLFFALFAFGHVRTGSGSLKICKPAPLHPANFAVSPPNAVFVRSASEVMGSSATSWFVQNLAVSSGCTRF
jgi:hypothetical protein